MYKASDKKIASTIINYLDPHSINLIMLKVPEGDTQTYAKAKGTIFYKISYKKQFLAAKTKFLNVKFLPNKTLDQFTNYFYHQL